MRRYIVYRESDHKYVTETIGRERRDWSWGDREDAVWFTGHTLPVLWPGEQVEELPSTGGR